MAGSLSREEAIATYRADFGRLRSAAMRFERSLQASRVLGEWTVKDVLAHIGAWDRELARGVQELLARQRPAFASYAEDEFNAAVIARTRERSFDDVLADAEQAHAALMQTVQQLTDEQWNDSSAYTWPDGAPITIASVFDYRYKGQTHCAGHAAEIEAGLTKSAQ